MSIAVHVKASSETTWETMSSQFEAGVLAYQNGLYNEAEMLWLQVKEGPDAAQAAYNLAVLYEAGRGFRSSDKNIVHWYKLAATKGLAEAQFNFGGLYYHGKRVPREVKTAIHWWRKAAFQGHAEAQYNLGLLRYEGKEVAQELVIARRWFSRAMDQDYTPATDYFNKTQAEISKRKNAIKKGMSEAYWLKHELWLFRQRPENFTLELYRGKSFQEAHDIAASNQIIKLVRFYPSNVDVVMVAGSFKTERETLSMLAKMSKSRTLPFSKVRSIQSVQTELRVNQ